MRVLLAFVSGAVTVGWAMVGYSFGGTCVLTWRPLALVPCGILCSFFGRVVFRVNIVFPLDGVALTTFIPQLFQPLRLDQAVFREQVNQRPDERTIEISVLRVTQ